MLAIDQEPNPIIRVLLHSPKDTLAGTVAVGGVLAIMINALFLQASRHPSPMFGAAVEHAALLAPPAALPPARMPPPQLQAQQQALTSPAPASQPMPRARPAEAERRTAASEVARPPAAIPVQSDPVGDLIVSTRRVTLVQRALTEYGYGQLKPTGVVGPDTQIAIKKFEIDRRRPPTGQMSEWLRQEIVKLTGRPID